MPYQETNFLPKSRKDIRRQLNSAQAVLGKKTESSLIRPSESQRDILKMPLQEIKQRYARRYETYLKLLRTRGGGLPGHELHEMKKWLKALNSLDRYIERHRTGEERILRERQFTAYEDLREFIERGGTNGYIKMPPRVGKTVLFSEFIEALDLPKILIVTSRKALITQTANEVEKHAPGLEIGRLYSRAKEYGRQVTITSYESLVKQVEDGKIHPEEYDCLILDEAHRALSKRRQSVVKTFTNALKIGFSATPTFSKEKNLKKFLGTEIHSMDIREAVEEGLLCPFSSIIAKTKTDISNVKISSTGEYNPHQLEKAVNNKARNIAAVNLYKQMFMGEKAIASCVGVQHAKDMAAEFAISGIPAAAIHGKQSETEQNKLKQQLSRGEIVVLCNADILIEGVDIPQVSVCLNARPVRSRIIAEQRARALTLDKNRPDKHAFIVDFIDEGAEEDPPILFSQIAGGAEIKTKEPQDRPTKKYLPKKQPKILVEGLEVITEATEIMKIVNKFDLLNPIPGDRMILLKNETLIGRTFDINKPADVRELLLSTKTKEELTIIGVDEFRKTSFGKGTVQIKGAAILVNFGTHKENRANLQTLFEFAGLEKEQEVDLANPAELNV